MMPACLSRSVRPAAERPRLWALALALLLLFGTPGLALGQTPLQLLDRVDGLGQAPQEGPPLPESTRVVTLQYDAAQPHTLPNAGVSRADLARQIQERLRTDGPQWLDARGRTAGSVVPTRTAGAVYYVLAETPDGRLYESYVNTGTGFVPGYDAVQSGRMSMGPVPEPIRPQMQDALRMSPSTPAEASDPSASAPTDSATAPTSDTTTQADASPTGTSGDPPDEPTSSAQAAPSPAGAPSGAVSSWWIVLSGIGGVLIGAGAAWWWLSVRLRRLEEDRADLRHALQEQKRPDDAAPRRASASDDQSDAVEQLRDENEALRERNETLQRQITAIKERVEALREKQS